MIKVGVNALPLIYSITGIGRITYETIKHLAQQEGIELYLYTCAPLKVDLSSYKNIHIKMDPDYAPKKFFKQKIIWQQLRLPQLARQDQLDLFWSPRHQLPSRTINGIPQVLTVYDLVAKKFPETMKPRNLLIERLFFKSTLKKADHVITISNAAKNDLCEFYNYPSSQISVSHPSFFELAQHQPTDLTTLGLTKPFILYIGTLEPRKNLSRLIDAYLNLPAELKAQYDLVFAGGKGWKSEALLEKVKQIKYLGYVDDATAYTLLKQATLFAFPSLYEGFGLPILEAMNLGTPVLTSIDPACKETAGGAAYLVNPLDTNDIKEGLVKFLTNAALRQEFINKGLVRVQNFSWDRSAKQYLEVFKKVLARNIV
jgi:glycosyltransferase involved in cell wall biosynthesis